MLGMLLERRRRARLKPGGSACRNQPDARFADREHDAADQAARPVELRIRVLRPADLDAHARPFGAGRAVDDLRIARFAAAGSRPRRAVRHRPEAVSGRMAEQRKLVFLERHGREGDRRQLLRLAVLREQRSASTWRAASCQIPRPIISATAAATTIVGMSGSRASPCDRAVCATHPACGAPQPPQT